ncbi:MAG TPA: F0F1 ATP synthase subunit B [Gammaproteobacteria bacterium]|nr:F0F1 ATP synthase subunit B [Gammaproteobacteria bacterium]
MDINATLIGQMITFALFVWFTMKFVWPHLEKILHDRQQKIAEGLAAAERGHYQLEISKKNAIEHMQEARNKAIETIEHAKKLSATIIEEAKAEAIREREKIVALGHEEIAQALQQAKAHIQMEMVELTIKSTEKLLGRVISESDQKMLLDIGMHYPTQKQ